MWGRGGVGARGAPPRRYAGDMQQAEMRSLWSQATPASAQLNTWGRTGLTWLQEAILLSLKK